ncbi:hypothetical protein AKJ61_02375 [candidate division MSBL1 archaeon SCGC-AAA259B11]|uniref:Uncharacterized protein n=1 Tax=candidate division MSBL1 archaeon SCGC-AAA259B11 TaxID=1698260 RepID=A0A133U676_9EURY|nr:hypothetical protein AKJ61_02375 [candidate division MSBL1 archaeon SCGC-AAA259B11]
MEKSIFVIIGLAVVVILSASVSGLVLTSNASIMGADGRGSPRIEVDDDPKGKMLPPIEVKLTSRIVQENNFVKIRVDLSSRLSSRLPARLEVQLSPGLTLVDGETRWSGLLYPSENREVVLAVAPIKSSNLEVKVSGYTSREIIWKLSQGEAFSVEENYKALLDGDVIREGDVERIHLTTQNGKIQYMPRGNPTSPLPMFSIIAGLAVLVVVLAIVLYRRKETDGTS